jgi:hypothetical protein
VDPLSAFFHTRFVRLNAQFPPPAIFGHIHIHPRRPFSHLTARSTSLAVPVVICHCRNYSSRTSSTWRTRIRDIYLDAFLTPRSPPAASGTREEIEYSRIMSSASSSPPTDMPSATSTRATSVGSPEVDQIKVSTREGGRAGRFRQPGEIECWGHRGASAHLPENT